MANLSKEEAKAAFKEAVREEIRELRKEAGSWVLDWIVKIIFTAISTGLFYLYLNLNGWRKIENASKHEEQFTEGPRLSGKR